MGFSREPATYVGRLHLLRTPFTRCGESLVRSSTAGDVVNIWQFEMQFLPTISGTLHKT